MRRHVRFLVVALLCTGAAASFVAAPALAQLPPYDVPVITCEDATISSITLNVCGGATTGAPAGLTIQWKLKEDFEVSGWADDGTLCKLSLSGQPSLQHPDKSRWELLPGECVSLKIGDINFDETGVSGTGCGLDALECGKTYVFRWFAHAGRGFGRSDWGGNLECSTLPCPPGGQCTFTQGYWKNHGTGDCQKGGNTDQWPASIRSGGLDLGTNHYSADDLCAILNRPAKGCGLLSMAHQLIAAYLNIANGAKACPELASVLPAAHAAIGSTNLLTTSCSGGGVPFPNDVLTSFNEGTLCGPHCDDTVPRLGAQPVQKSPWGTIKQRYR